MRGLELRIIICYDKQSRRVDEMERKYFIACSIVFGLLFFISCFVTLKCLGRYKDENVLVQSPCENMESIGIIPRARDDCSVWMSQKRQDLNIYELFNRIQDEFSDKFVIFPIVLVFLCLFMPCDYLREKKKNKKNLESNELKKNTYQYAYIPVVMIPLIFSLIFFICGFVCNNYQVVATNWQGNNLIYILMYYMLFMIGSSIFSLIIINVCLICVQKIHSYIGAIILSSFVLLLLEVATEFVSVLPSLINFFHLTNVNDLLLYLIMPTIFLVLSFIILKCEDKKEIVMS